MSDLDAVFIASYLRHPWEDIGDSKRLAGRQSEAYHAQQAAEEFINAVLVSEGLHPNPREVGHSLDARIELLPDENPWKRHLAQMSFLESYAATTRYPRTPTGRVNRVADTSVIRIRVARDKLGKMALAAGVHHGVNLDFSLDEPARNTQPYRSSSGTAPPMRPKND